MARQGETDTDSIQLHFCQRCGISIPEQDIATSRAKAAPGGYVCVGCIYQQRDEQLSPTARPARATPRAPAPSTGTRAIAAVAMLYLVGTTTFLLFRELNRKPPELVLPPVATAQDVQVLSRKLDAVDEQTRKALAQLKSNDSVQGGDLGKLNRGLNKVQRHMDDHVSLVKTQHKDLVRMITELSDRTVGLTSSAKAILSGISDLEDAIPPKADPPAPSPEVKDTGKLAAKDKPEEVVDPEKKKLVDKFVKQLLDRSVDKQQRFNAAVQLGDLLDPSSLGALVTALRKDPYDLVRRAAAYSLGMLGKHAVRAIPDLIQQMDDKQEYVGYMCERALGDITKAALGAAVSFGLDPAMNAARRRDIQRKWQDWWEKNKATLLPG